MAAYNAERWQLTGPDWLIRDYLPGSPRVDLSAKIPDGTTKEQFALMLQDLLEERFGIVVHHTKKEMRVYYLKEAKSGAKLMLSPRRPTQASDAIPQASAVSKFAPKLDSDRDGFPVLPPGSSMVSTGNRSRMRASNESMDAFAVKLTGQLGQPVTNATRLRGEYDFSLYWSGAEVTAGAETGPTLFQALQQQLGLTLEPAKGEVDVLVIDHIEKTPTAN